MLRTMSFLEETTGKEVVLPVTPQEYFWKHPSRSETVRLDQAGEISLPAGRKAGSCTLKGVLLPAQLYPFCTPGARADPYGYLYDLQVWCDRGSKVRWIVSGTSVNVAVLLESVDQGERDGTNDLYVDITMREWRRAEAPTLALSGGEAGSEREGSPTGQNQSYTVQKGDCLWNIARKFYGDGKLYTRLAAANPEIKNPNLVYPGQTLVIPAADTLPAAGALPASAALANQITATTSGGKTTLVCPK